MLMLKDWKDLWSFGYGSLLKSFELRGFRETHKAGGIPELLYMCPAVDLIVEASVSQSGCDRVRAALNYYTEMPII